MFKMSYLIKARLNFTSNFLDQLKIIPNLNISVNWVDLNQRFWNRLKISQLSHSIIFKNSRLCLEFLNLIIHDCELFKQYSNYIGFFNK